MRTETNGCHLGIDLFSGAGGLSLGFEQAGFRIVYALEKDKYAAETYGQNRNSTTIIEVNDITRIHADEVLRKLGLAVGDLNIILGGPPCQGFSISNMRTRTESNPANQLVFKFCELVEQLKPKWFVMENVAGLDSFSNGKMKEALLGLFRQTGYQAEAIVLDASRLGVPQVRKRIFFVGNRIGKRLDFLRELAECGGGATIAVREAMNDLPVLINGNSTDRMPYAKGCDATTQFQRSMRLQDSTTVSNNLVSRNNALVLERYKYIEQGENWRALANKKPELLHNYKDLTKCHEWIYLRLRWDRPSVVISNYRKNMLIHPDQDRGLSVREAARLQSFPDDYTFHGPLGYQQQQVANAVPPLLAKHIAVEILST